LLSLVLHDRSGEIEAKIWDNGEEWFRKLRDSDVVKVSGRTKIYNGNLELTVERVRIAREGEFELEDFLPSTERDSDDMLAGLSDVISAVKDPFLRKLLDSFFEGQCLREFATAPAAKSIHHAYLGGLLEHTLEVVKLCETCLQIYPNLDRDILITGALLHDVGKIKEYDYRRSIEFSDEGRLIGHIVLGEQMILQKAAAIEGFPSDMLLKLRHMVLSHHGQYEWQSPKRPKTIEACVLHLADNFSGQVATFTASIKASANNGSAWTSYNKFLERSIYMGTSPAMPFDEEAIHGYRRVMEEEQGYLF
jgi:3'-5' exoribonuclease